MPYVRKVNTGFDKSDLQEQQQQEQQEQEEQQRQQQLQLQQEQRQQQRQEQQQQQHARKGFLNTDFDQSDLSGQVTSITKQMDEQRAWCLKRYGYDWQATDRAARLAEARAALSAAAAAAAAAATAAREA